MQATNHDLTPLQRDVLRAFFDREGEFFLTGGAALVGYYLHHRETTDLDLFATKPEAFERGRFAVQDAAAALGLTTVVSRMEARDLVDLFLLERAGYKLEQSLAGALAKDGGCTPATLAWLLSEVEIPDQARLPGGVDPGALRAWLNDVVPRLRRAAAPSIT